MRKAAEAAMPVMPTEIYSNFHLSGLAHAYQNAANNQRAMQFVGNDWTAVNAMRQQANQGAASLELEKARQTSAE
jgi:hypothetical protein